MRLTHFCTQSVCGLADLWLGAAAGSGDMRVLQPSNVANTHASCNLALQRLLHDLA